jgi:hypothetical protein
MALRLILWISTAPGVSQRLHERLGRAKAGCAFTLRREIV